MKTDTEIRLNGLRALTEALGDVEAERFIALIQRDPFDYTKWQKELWPDESVEETSRRAMNYRSSTGS